MQCKSNRTLKRMHKKGHSNGLATNIIKNYEIYLMLLPVVAYFIIFKYIPMYGLQIAFKNFKPTLGDLGQRLGRAQALFTFFQQPLFSENNRKYLQAEPVFADCGIPASNYPRAATELSEKYDIQENRTDHYLCASLYFNGSLGGYASIVYIAI